MHHVKAVPLGSPRAVPLGHLHLDTLRVASRHFEGRYSWRQKIRIQNLRTVHTLFCLDLSKQSSMYGHWRSDEFQAAEEVDQIDKLTIRGLH